MIGSWESSQEVTYRPLRKWYHTVNTKRLIEKHIYSSNRNKIQVNLVKQSLVNRKLRVLWGRDYLSTTQMVSYVIVSRWLVNSVWCSRWHAFMEEGNSIMLGVQKIDRYTYMHICYTFTCTRHFSKFKTELYCILFF